MEKTDQTDAFWREVKATVPGVDDTYRIRRLGSTQEMSEALYDLIKNRDKTGTFGLKLLHDRDPANAPAVGSCTVFIDFEMKPHIAVKVMSLKPTAYEDITEDHLTVEGPGARVLKTWQDIHWPYWTKLLKPLGLEPSQDMIVMVEQFDLVFPQAV